MKRIFVIFLLFGLILNTFAQSKLKKDYIYANDELFINDLNFTSWLLDSTGAALGAFNLLTKSGNNIKFGGLTTENTEVQGVGYNLDLGTSSSRFGTFGLYGSILNLDAIGAINFESDNVEWSINENYFIVDRLGYADTLYSGREVRDITDNINEAQPQPFNLQYTYLEDFIDQRPGVGNFSVNSSIITSVTRINLDDFDNIYEAPTSIMLQQADTGSVIVLINVNDDPNIRAFFRVESFSNESGYTKYNVSLLADDGVDLGEGDNFSFTVDINNNTGGGGGGVVGDTVTTKALISEYISVSDSALIGNLLITADEQEESEAILQSSNGVGNFLKFLSGGAATLYSPTEATLAGENSAVLNSAGNEVRLTGTTLYGDGSNNSSEVTAQFTNFVGDSANLRAATVDSLGFSDGSDNITGTGNGKELIEETEFEILTSTKYIADSIQGKTNDSIIVTAKVISSYYIGESNTDDGSITISTTPIDTYTTITGMTPYLSVNTTVTDSTITVASGGSGYYNVYGGFSYTHSNTSTICRVSLFVNDVENTINSAERKIGVGGDFGDAGRGSIIWLSDGDVVKFKARGDGTGTLTINYGTIYISRIN